MFSEYLYITVSVLLLFTLSDINIALFCGSELFRSRVVRVRGMVIYNIMYNKNTIVS